MKLEQASYSLDNVIQIKESVHEYLKQRNHEETPTVTNDRISAGILSDTRYSWLSCGPRLQVLHTKSGAKVAAWCFRAQHDFETCVTCICDLPNTRGKAPLLVVGLECEITGGMLCVFDVGSSRVLRAIQIDDKVTSIEVVSGGGDGGLPGVLRALDGVIAVGTAKGKVLLVDLCRQLCDEAISNTSNESIRDEINSCNLIHISFEDLRNLERHKEMSLNKGDHLCLQLNEDSTSSVHFSLFGPTGDLRLRANMSEVIISSLHFSQALGSLLIGFNFGAWQLYHLVATPYPVLAYTSPMYEDCVPVSHFAVQEPCDDPRAFCYVWVVYSIQQTDIVRDSETDTAMSVMYSLTYNSKEYLEDYGVIYQDLQACAVRFQIELANIVPGGRTTAARCVTLRAYTRQLSVDAPEERLALCSIVWTCWDTANPTVAPETYLALFDLNQWYKEQMPGQPRAETDRYMVCVNVTELMASYGDGKVRSEDILDLRLDSTSLSPFTCSQRLEEHYYPSALAFKSLVVSGRRLGCVVSWGTQRHLLSQLELAGPLCLLQPGELYTRCVSLGLCDVTANPSARQQREAVLSVALEHQLVRWLCRCARDWAAGAQSSAGCTLDFLLHWAWQQANCLKFNCDKLCVPLFDHSGQRLDHNALQQLNHAACQIKHLSTLFDTVLNYCYMYFTEQDIEDIRYQHNTLSMITTYLEVLQWLLNVGLLPECPLSMYPLPDHAERLSAPYPAESLSRFYNSRRTELQNDDEKCLLFIDQLISRECGGERLIQQWKGDGGSGWYPPPSLQALLRTYLVDDIAMQYKHCLVIYVFLDLAMTLDQSRYKSIITHLIKFPAVFKLSPSVIKITQAFWQLDHGDFSTAMAQFLDPAVANEDLKPWHHRIVLKALLVQGQHQHALLYHQVRKPPVSSVQDTCIIITLLIVNDLLQEAFHFQRQNRSVYNEQEILKHFFTVSDKVNHLNNVLQLPLSPIEESSFISYLRANPSETNENLLVIYYLQRDRYDEAFRANDNLNAEFNKKHVKQGILGQQERIFRNVIVEGFKKTLPDVTQVLLDIVEKEKQLLKDATWQNFARPLPMSVFVHNTQEQAKYKSTLIQASFRKAKETWTHKLHDDDNETPFISTPKVLPATDKSNGTPLIYATAMHLPTSTSAELDIDSEVTPAKRMRLSPRQPISETLRRKQRLSSGQSPSLSLLDTPIVKRKSYRDSPASSIVGTPASILKVRSFIRSSVSPDTKDDRGTSTTPENLEPDLPDTEMEVDVGLTPLDRTTANAIKSVGLSLNRSRRSSLGVSPRRPITRTPRPAVHFEDAAPSDKQHLEVCVEVHREQTPDISSKDSSRSIDDVFYSPDASISDRSKDNTVQEEIQVEEDVRMSLKRKASDSVKSRRSYKAATPVTKVSSPVIKVERNLRSRNSSLTPVKTSEASPEPRKSEVFPKLGGRRSLTRQVLEQNTLAKVLPKMQTRLSLNARENEKTVGVEVSYSKTVTSIVKKTSDTVTEEKCDKSTVETKNIYTTETDPDKKQTIKHVHNESSSKSSVKKISEVVDESDKSFKSCSTDKTDSNYHILSFSSDVDESFIRNLKWDEHKDETINKSIANTTQYTSDENNDTNQNISMEEVIEQPDNPKYSLTQTVFEDISSIVETSYEDEEESKVEEDMETSIPKEIAQTEESVVNIEESMETSIPEEIQNNVSAQKEKSIINIEDSIEEIKNKEESAVNIEESMETSVQEEIINTVQSEEAEAVVNIEQQQTVNKQSEEESIVDIEESSKDSSESEKISNQSSDNEEPQQQEESSVESPKPQNYLVPSSEEDSDEEEKTSDQDEEEQDLKFIYEEVEEEQEVEEPEDTEDSSSSNEEESNHSSHSSDVIEIKSSSEDSQHVEDLNLNISEKKQIESENEEDQEEMEEEHDPLKQDKNQEKIEEDLKLNISEEKHKESEDEEDQEEMEDDPLQQDKDQEKVEEDLKLNISEEKQIEADDEQDQREMEEEQDKDQEKIGEDLKLNISEEKQIEAEDEQDQVEMEQEQDQLEVEKHPEKLEEEPDQVEEENPEEIVEHISEKNVTTEQENILVQNVYEPSSISEQVVETEEIIQTTEPVQDPVQQEEDMDIPEDIQQEIEECMQEEQQLQELITTQNKSKDDVSQDCLETMSFTTPQEQLQKTDILCDENFADKPTEEILEMETDTQVEQTETGTDLLENLPEKPYTPSRRSKRISSKQQEEIKPEIPARITRKRSTSIDVDKIEQPSARTTRKRSTSIDIENTEPLEPKPSARTTRKRSTSIDIENTEPLEPKPSARITRKRSTSVDTEDVPLENRKSPGRITKKRSTSTDEPPKPTRASTRTRSTSVDIDPKPGRSSTRRRSTNSDVEETLKPATRTRTRSTSVDIEEERSTRASSLLNLPAIPEEVNRNKRASSSEPSRRGRKRSITVIPEEPESEEHIKKAALENIPEKIEEYSATHRLTRRQKTMMEKSLEIQELKKLQPQELKPRLAKSEDNLELEEHLARSPSSVSTDTQSTDPGTPQRRSSRRLSTTSTPTRRSTRNSKDAADDDSSVKSVPVIKLDREDIVRYRSLSPTALKEPSPSPKATKGRRKSTRSSILPVPTDLSKISEETAENESSSSQETRPKRGRPRKDKDKEEQATQSSEKQETKLTKRKTSSFGPYIQRSVIQPRKSFKVKTILTRK